MGCSFSQQSTQVCDEMSKSSGGILVPAYNYPVKGQGYWEQLAKSSLSGVPLRVIVNPHNGPGVSCDPQYSWAIELVRSSNAEVLGYVHTSYGKRNIDDVLRDADSFHKLYHVTDFFVDEVSSDTSEQLRYYSKLVHSLKKRGRCFVIGNPGSSCSLNYLDSVGFDALVTFEDTCEQFLRVERQIGVSEAHRHRLACLVHTAPREVDISLLFLRAKQLGFGWCYFTDALMPNPWDRLPSFWTDELRTLLAFK